MSDDDLWVAPLLKTARVVPWKLAPLWEFAARIIILGQRCCAITGSGVLKRRFTGMGTS
jgi:hypothetical protein